MVVESVGDFAEAFQGIAIERSGTGQSLRSKVGMSVERTLIFYRRVYARMNKSRDFWLNVFLAVVLVIAVLLLRDVPW